MTQYELWKAVWSSLDTVNFHELEWTLGRHAEFLEHFVPMTFVGNHDTTRVASQIHDQRHWPHAVALLGFLPGVPCVYYGDEFGLEAVKEDRVDGDDAVRPALPAGAGPVRRPAPRDRGGLPPGLLAAPAALLARRRGDVHRAGGQRAPARPRPRPERRRSPHPGAQPGRQAVRPPCGCVGAGGRAGRQESAVPPHGWAVLEG